MNELLLLELSALVSTNVPPLFILASHDSLMSLFMRKSVAYRQAIKSRNFAKRFECIFHLFSRHFCMLFACYFSEYYKVKCDWLVRADLTEIL